MTNLKLSYLEYVDPANNNNKFWLVAHNATWAIYNWGRIGNNGQSTAAWRTDGDDPFDRIDGKRAKGYVLELDIQIDVPPEFVNVTDKDKLRSLASIIKTKMNDAEAGVSDEPGVSEGDENNTAEAVDVLAQRALELITLAATDPSKAVVEYAQMMPEYETQQAKFERVKNCIDTVEAMLAIREEAS